MYSAVRAGIFACVCVLGSHSAAYGDGFRLPYQGSAAAGQAEAFAAQADDPSALYYNPAGLTQLRGFQLYTGANFVGGQVSFTGPTGQTARGDLGGSAAFPPPSHFYITANLSDLGFKVLGPLTVGLGVNTPFGLITRYPDEAPFASVVTHANLPLIDIKPTLAYRITQYLSVGLGADIYTFASFLGEGQFELKTRPAPGVSTELNGNGTSTGFNASLLVTPFRNAEDKPILNLGFIYRSQAILHLTGQTLVNGTPLADAKTTLVLPQVLTAAVAVWPIRTEFHEWKVEYDMDFVGWNAFRSFDVELSGGNTVRTPQNWKTIYGFSIGSEFKWLRPTLLPYWDIAVRAGFQRSHTPVPAQYFTPAIPDANWNIFAVGAGFMCKENGRMFSLIACQSPRSGIKGIGVDLAYEAAPFETRAINGNVNANVNGTYKTTLHIGSISLRLVF